MILPIWAKPALAAVALALAFSGGWTVNGWRWEAKQTKALKQAQMAFERQLERQTNIAAAYENDRETIRQEGNARETEIRTIFRTVEVPARCAAPDSVRSVLDRAVTDANAAAGQPDAELSAPAEPAAGSR